MKAKSVEGLHVTEFLTRQQGETGLGRLPYYSYQALQRTLLYQLNGNDSFL